jgi:hypothetical protein
MLIVRKHKASNPTKLLFMVMTPLLSPRTSTPDPILA